MKDLSSALLYKTSYLTIEVIGFKQLFEGKVHTIAPIVEGISGNIDALETRVCIAQVLVDSHPIL